MFVFTRMWECMLAGDDSIRFVVRLRGDVCLWTDLPPCNVYNHIAFFLSLFFFPSLSLPTTVVYVCMYVCMKVNAYITISIFFCWKRLVDDYMYGNTY